MTHFCLDIKFCVIFFKNDLVYAVEEARKAELLCVAAISNRICFHHTYMLVPAIKLITVTRSLVNCCGVISEETNTLKR